MNTNLTSLATDNVPKETTDDGAVVLDLRKVLNKGEDENIKVFERETGMDFCCTD